MARLTKKVKLGVPRFLVLVLVAAVCGIQYPLWVGKGSNATLLDLQDQLKTQKEKNAALELVIDYSRIKKMPELKTPAFLCPCQAEKTLHLRERE